MQPVQSLVRIADIRNGAFSRGVEEPVPDYEMRILDMEPDEADNIWGFVDCMERGEAFPPIFLARIEGKLELLDGFHRLAAMALRGRDAVRAVVFEAGSYTMADQLSGLFFAYEGTGATWQQRAEAGANMLAA
jgi:hypothetical protein